MRHFWQWFCGYVCISLKGRQINRFLNLCSRNGIHLWRIVYDVEHTLRANLRLRDFYSVKPYLRKTKTKLRIIRKRGFPFWCHRHPRLKWFYCLCFFLICVGIYSLGFVWNIEVRGNDVIATSEIIACLEENEVLVGEKKARIDCTKIEILLRENFHQLGWVSVYFERTNLCVEIKESLYDTLEQVEPEIGRAYHLIANKDAKIYSIVTRAGKALVKKEEFVHAGDILVLGQSEIFNDNGEIKETLLLKAEALVYGDVEYEITFPIYEMELVALKIANQMQENALLHLGYRKMQAYIENLEANGVIILATNGMIEKKEKNICFRAKIYAREQIGISIPVEEVLENEFE